MPSLPAAAALNPSSLSGWFNFLTRGSPESHHSPVVGFSELSAQHSASEKGLKLLVGANDSRPLVSLKKACGNSSQRRSL